MPNPRRSIGSEDFKEEGSSSSTRKERTRRFDAPGLSFSAEGAEILKTEQQDEDEASLDESAYNTIGTRDIQKSQPGCSPFCSSSTDKKKDRRRTVSVSSPMKDEIISTASSSASKTKKADRSPVERRSSFAVTASNIFNILYPENDDQTSTVVGLQSTISRSVSECNTKSTLGDTTLTTISGTYDSSSRAKSNKYRTALTQSASDTLTRSTIADTTTTFTSPSRASHTASRTKSSSTGSATYTDDGKSSLTQSYITNRTNLTVFSPKEPVTIDPIQQALEDLAAVPVPENRPRRGVLKHPGITRKEISERLDELDRVVAQDDSSNKATMEEPVIYHHNIEVEREPSVAPPPVLHRFCLTVTRPADLLKARDLITATSASETDAIGRLAMHCLSDNIILAEAMAYPEDTDNWNTTTIQTKRSMSSSPISHSSHTTRQRNNRAQSMSRKSISPKSKLTEEDLEEYVIDFVVNGLLKAYPAAMISMDGIGQVPFESALSAWVEQELEVPEEFNPSERKRKFSAEKFASVSALWNRTIGGSSMWIKSRDAENTEPPQLNGRSTSTQSSASHQDVEGGKRKMRAPSFENNHVESDRYFPTNVRLTASVYFAVKILSAILDALDTSMLSTQKQSFMSPGTASLFNSQKEEKDSSLKLLNDTTSSDIRTEIIHSMASIPNLVKVILLMEDEEQRDFVMTSTLGKCVLSHPASVGTWLTHMLQSDERRVIDRALEYMELVSSEKFWRTVTPRMQNERHRRDTKQMNDLVDKKRVCFYDQVSQLPNFVPSLLSLGGRQIEEASTTTMVRSVLDRVIARPFCATFVFCDALFLALMIFGFRLAVHRFIMNEAPGNILSFVYISNMGIFYFVIRELGKAVSLSMINRRVRLYFFSFWNVSDLWATFLALISTVAIRSHFSKEFSRDDTVNAPNYLRLLLTVTTGFMWLRVLSFLKGINMQLATFVLAILQISRDVIWFCVIVITLLVSFGQMFFTLMAPDTCGVEPEAAACDQSEYYLKMYSMLIFQEFDRESYESFMTVLLVVIYSFMVVLVLLNVLIAVASDSYEKCLLRSQNLFGRARVMMISEMVSFQNLLRRSSGDVSALTIYKAWWSQDSAAGWSRGSIIFFSLSTLIVVIWIVAELAGYVSGPRHGNIMMSLGSILATALLFMCIMLFLSIGAGNESKLFERNGKKVWNGRLLNLASRFESIVHSIVRHLLGSTVRVDTSTNESTADEEWSGRVHFIRSEMKRIAIEQRAQTSEQVSRLEGLLREDMAKLESSLELLKREVSKPAPVLTDDVPSMLGVAIEALQKVQKTLR